MQDARRTSIVADFMNHLSHAPTSALLLDYDGTLAPFQTERDHAYPYPGVIPILERIIRSGRTRVVVISGRPVHEVRALLGSFHFIPMHHRYDFPLMKIRPPETAALL